MELLLTFTEPQHAIEIEDTLDGFGYSSRIIHTPIDVLEVNVFFCKTSLLITNADSEIYGRLEGIPVAGLFQSLHGRYEALHSFQRGV